MFVISLLFAVPLFAIPLASQTQGPFGGASTLIHQYDGGAIGDYLGNSVANAGDINGDGIDDQLVGAYGSSPGGLFQAGSAFAYSGADGTLLYQFNGVASGDRFGYSVTGVGDVNADGFDDFLIGAPSTDTQSLLGNGSAFVYSGASGSVIYRFDGIGDGYQLGTAVAAAGDLDGDGTGDFLISASGYKAIRYGSIGTWGVVRAYSGATGAVLHEIIGGPFGSANISMRWAYDIAGAGDVNGDGYDDFILGDYSASWINVSYAGGLVVFSGFDGSVIHIIHGTTPHENFGWAIHGAGDVDGDGYDDFIAQSNWSNPMPGTVRVYSGFSGTLLYLFGEQRANYSAGGRDIDDDGVADICVIWPAVWPVSEAHVIVFSGATGTPLMRIDDIPSFVGWYQVAFAGDIDGDQREDFLIGAFDRSQYATSMGVASVVSWVPLMSADQDSISVATGGTISLDLDFPDTVGPLPYKVLFSAAGVGSFLDGVGIPLTKDSWTIASYQGVYPFAVSTNLHGALSNSGDASASFTLSPNQLRPFMIGRTVRLAVVANQSGQRPAEYSSVAVAIEITP